MGPRPYIAIYQCKVLLNLLGIIASIRLIISIEGESLGQQQNYSKQTDGTTKSILSLYQEYIVTASKGDNEISPLQFDWLFLSSSIKKHFIPGSTHTFE